MRSSGGLSRQSGLREDASGPTSQSEQNAYGVESQKESLSVESSPKIEKSESRVYLDSSALIKLYYTESESKALSSFVSTLQHALPFSHLHELEMKNGLRLKIFRGEASRKSVEAAIRLVELDHSAGVLERPDLNWFDVFRRAQSLSVEYTSGTGSRSLDLLHVASALLLKTHDFLTFDDRQSALARNAGMNCISI